MSLVSRFSVGSLRCACLHAGHMRLDGGAMFGVVAKPLWEKHFQADDRNRVRLALRCLLVEHEKGPVLIDTGIGNKEDEKFMSIYGVDNAGAEGRTLLEDALSEAGIRPEDVKWVINTHLHFDHGGGNTFVEVQGQNAECRMQNADRGRQEEREGGTAVPPYRRTAEGGEVGSERTALPPYRPTAHLTFPNATYVVQRGELEAAENPNERTSASYLSHNFQPVSEADVWLLVEGESEVLPGISVLPTPGHTPFHQSVLISDRGEVACFLGDLVPTAAHVPLPWIMAYDLQPLETLQTKRNLLARAEADGWIVVFEHDPLVATGRIVRGEKSYTCVPLDTPTMQA